MTQIETVPENPENIYKCKNCEKSFFVDYLFCPHCGQKKVDRLSLPDLFSNFVGNYLSVDSRFFKSIGPLLFKPGFLPARFVEGKQETYLHPARMYLFVSVIFFFVFSFFIRDSELKIQFGGDEMVSQLEADATSSSNGLGDSLAQNPEIIGFMKNRAKVDSLIDGGAEEKEILITMGMKEDAGFFTRKMYKQYLKLYQDNGVRDAYNSFFNTIPIAMFFLLPLFALILFIFHHRHGSYANHLVFSCYYFSFVFNILGILYSAYWWFNGLPAVLDWVLGVAPVLYLLFGLKNFYNQSWKSIIWKVMGILCIFLLIFVPITLGMVVLYAFLNF